MAKIVELIITEDRIGNGTEKSPVRLCVELYSKSGKLVARYDPVTKEMIFMPENLDQI